MPTRPRRPRASEPAGMDGAALFRIAENALIGLYERGVLSPAVAEQCIAAFSGTGIDWDTTPTRKSSDGKRVFEVLAAVLMPGQATRTPAKAARALIATIERAAGAQESGTREGSEPDDGDDELVAQFAAATGQTAGQKSGRTRRATGATGAKTRVTPSGTTQPRGFAPLVNARLPRTSTR